MVKENLVGQRFGRWTVLERVHKSNSKKPFVKCICDCGTVKVVRTDSLKRGDSISCRCYLKEVNRNRIITHGLSRTRLYGVWKMMHERCENPKNDHFLNYGARGISVCKEWSDVSQFHKWAYENGYDDHLTIDRIDVNGNYEPSNCRFVTVKQQMRNTRVNHMLEYDGERKCLAEWAEIYNLDADTISARLKRGWDIERALTGPIRKTRR